jgi:hypothetical protein
MTRRSTGRHRHLCPRRRPGRAVNLGRLSAGGLLVSVRQLAGEEVADSGPSRGGGGPRLRSGTSTTARVVPPCLRGAGRRDAMGGWHGSSVQVRGDLVAVVARALPFRCGRGSSSRRLAASGSPSPHASIGPIELGEPVQCPGHGHPPEPVRYRQIGVRCGITINARACDRERPRPTSDRAGPRPWRQYRPD